MRFKWMKENESTTLTKKVLTSLEQHIAEQGCSSEKELYLDRNCKSYNQQPNSDLRTQDILGWRGNCKLETET